MRSLAKSPVPPVLEENHETWTADFLADPGNATNRYRYRHPDIKNQLRQETDNKCVYCESKVGHNTPGDVEHKIPSSVQHELHFSWDNLTITCTECNRRKNDYFNEDAPFLDPYVDDVDSRVVHHGPIVGWIAGDECAEITVSTLNLHDGSRVELLRRKIEKISEINHVLARRESSQSTTLRQLLTEQLGSMQSGDAEYSAMVRAVCEGANG